MHRLDAPQTRVDNPAAQKRWPPLKAATDQACRTDTEWRLALRRRVAKEQGRRAASIDVHKASVDQHRDHVRFPQEAW